MDHAAARDLSLDQLLQGLRALRKLGPMGLAVLKRLPAFKGAPKELLTKERLLTLEEALDAMTPEEREKGRVSRQRAKEIGRETGMRPEEFEAMLAMFTQMKKQGGPA